MGKSGPAALAQQRGALPLGRPSRRPNLHNIQPPLTHSLCELLPWTKRYPSRFARYPSHCRGPLVFRHFLARKGLSFACRSRFPANFRRAGEFVVGPRCILSSSGSTRASLSGIYDKLRQSYRVTDQLKNIRRKGSRGERERFATQFSSPPNSSPELRPFCSHSTVLLFSSPLSHRLALF